MSVSSTSAEHSRAVEANENKKIGSAASPPRPSSQSQIMSAKSASLHIIFAASLLLGQCTFIWPLDNGLALQPPMGWLAWERYVCEIDCKQYPDECIDASLFKVMADHLVSDGYKQLGYQYVNIDDCWSTKERDPKTSQLLADPLRFPQSIKPLADHVHSLGLRLGIYGDCGTKTCQLFPGQLNHTNTLDGNYYKLDADTFARWGIDSFKFDGCNMEVKSASHLCPPMGDYLNQTGRPMLFSCSWPAYENDENLPTDWELVVEKCNIWRAFGDIEDSWQSVLSTIDWFVKKQDIILRYHGPGHWFDADQLVIGDFGLSLEQERAQMAIWCIWASPLYMSNDLRLIDVESKKILQNPWAIQVNQDKMGIFGIMVLQVRDFQVFVKPIEPLDEDGCPSYAIVYLDRRTLGSGQYLQFKLTNLIGRAHEKLTEVEPNKWAKWSKCAERSGKTYDAYDVFMDKTRIYTNLKLFQDSLRLRVSPSGVRMVLLY